MSRDHFQNKLGLTQIEVYFEFFLYNIFLKFVKDKLFVRKYVTFKIKSKQKIKTNFN